MREIPIESLLFMAFLAGSVITYLFAYFGYLRDLMLENEALRDNSELFTKLMALAEKIKKRDYTLSGELQEIARSLDRSDEDNF